MSLDGTTIDVADTPANAEVFGRAGTGRGDGSAFPQLRMVALGERGTHASLWAAAAASGADLLWRAKGNAVLPVLGHLPDGSFRFELIASTDKRRRQDVRTVRVIEYTGPPPPAPPTGW